MTRFVILPISDGRRTLRESVVRGRRARVVRGGNAGDVRSTATRALAVRSGGFGSTERHRAGRPEARVIERTRDECSVGAAFPGPIG